MPEIYRCENALFVSDYAHPADVLQTTFNNFNHHAAACRFFTRYTTGPQVEMNARRECNGNSSITIE